MSVNPRTQIRRRASSVSQALSAIPLNKVSTSGQETNPPSPDTATSPEDLTLAEDPGANPSLQLNGSVDSFTAAQEVADEAEAAQLRRRKVSSTGEETLTPVASRPDKPKEKRVVDPFDNARYRSDGFWRDLQSGKWLLLPSSSFPLLLLPILLYLNHEYLFANSSAPIPKIVREALPFPGKNPWRAMLCLSGYAGEDDLGRSVYKRDWKDLAFIAYYTIFFSFFRQSITLYFLRPLAKWLGVPPGKFERFTEQGYALIYFGFFGSLGIYVMHGLPIWWYTTSAFWTTFPVIKMTGLLKAYYLLQASYWCQQTIILAAGVEKPRKDFKELIAHHIVTLWLIGWSYVLTLTYIGVAIFVTMDVSDVFLALAKCINYIDETASQPVFAFFVLVWTYMRHYLNIKILYSVWTEFDLVPAWARVKFEPWKETGLLAPWMRWMIFTPIFLLQLLNLFWWFLIMRILLRALFAKSLSDERSDDEEDE